MSEVKPVAGQWYEYTHAKQRVLCVAQNDKDACVIRDKDGEFEVVYAFNYDLLKHLPDCTGWDWEEETFPQWIDHQQSGKSRSNVACIKRTSKDLYVCVRDDGGEELYQWSDECAERLKSGFWKQITEAEALALLEKVRRLERAVERQR